MKIFNKKIQEQFEKMMLTNQLFRVEITGRQVWELYLKSFKKKDNPKFRDPASSVHNCNHCNNFIRRYGNIVAIDSNYNLMSIFDVVIDNEFTTVAKALSAKIKGSVIQDVFLETHNELNNLPYEKIGRDHKVFKLGVDKNVKRYSKEEAELYGVVKPDEVRTFNHMHLSLKKEFVDISGESIEAIMAVHRDNKNVFQRAMDEIPSDTYKLVLDLINQGSLLDGDTHLRKVQAMLGFKTQFDELAKAERDNWLWQMSRNLALAKFKNSLIGVLCSELAEGEEINKACQSWNKRVDPANYMKAVAPITKKQIAEAQKFVEDNGYVESFNRRLATMDDIKVTEILHSNVGKGEIASVSIFDKVKSTKSRHKRNEFKGIEEVGIEKFMSDILPGCASIEVYLENRHSSNFVTLTTAAENSKPAFKWDNNYSWTYNGNLAGKSIIKDAVKEAGGNVEGVLNFRLAWNDSDGKDGSDLDAWAKEPSGTRIGYSANYRKDQGNRRSKMSGQLDVDNTNPRGKLAVENITWTQKDHMGDGVYHLWVNQYSAINSQGFKAEIEFNGETHEYTYDQPVRRDVMVAEVTLRNGEFSIKHLLPSSSSDKEIYGLSSNHFQKVNLVCLSPNHWGKNQTGNKHYFFMLDDCKADLALRSFHNENLIPELAAHRKVLEVLGATNMIPPSDSKQLSGLGFNATIRDEVIVKLTGNFKRTLRVKF